MFKAIFSAAVLVAGLQAANPLGPGSGQWEVESPEDHGVNSAQLEEGQKNLFSNARTRECFVVIKDGALIHETYKNKKGNTTAHTAYSMTKTLGAILLGHGVKEYGIDIDADTTAYDVPSPVGYPVTARHIMSQNIAGASVGEQWDYDAMGGKWINTLPKILKKGSGVEVPQLFAGVRETLGLSPQFSFKKAAKDWASGASGTCRDWARIGQLMLNQGKWAGSQPVVNADYIADMTTPQKSTDAAVYANSCYGMLTWLPTRPDVRYPGPCYLASDVKVSADRYMPESLSDYFILGGIFGQNVVVIPEEKMVVVSMGFTLPDLQGLTKNAQKMVAAAWCTGLGKAC